MNWVWSKLGKLLGGLFLIGGGSISTGLLAAITLSHAAGGSLVILLILLVFFGLTPAAVGGWLLHTSAKAKQQFIREQFFQLLQTNRGRLSLIDFARETRLEPAISRHYLDAWAKEFSASFEVTESGEIYYIFMTDNFLPPDEPISLPWRQVIRRVIQSLEQ